MMAKFQLTIDCNDPSVLTRFWALALGYVVEAPPAGFDSWNAYLRSIGVPQEELDDAVDAADSLVDPDGVGPRIFFQLVPEGKVVKNRLHLDLEAGGGRSVALQTRRERVQARGTELVSAGATRLRVLSTPGLDHYGEVFTDPEGNEFCIH
jgi:hypothetical protein